MAGFKPTAEQLDIAHADARIVKANAFAGTGKSSTFVVLAESRPKERMLYIAFNKAIQEEAALRFPGNVAARTGHSLAFQAKGRPYGAVHRKLQGNMKPFHIVGRLVENRLVGSMPAALVNLYAGRVIETVKSYLVSADEEMTNKHVSIGNSPPEQKHFSSPMILQAARQTWDWMCDISSPVPMLHDGYLKLYQLSNPRLPYETILFDEAQDTNPVMQAIVGSQAGRIAYVGDRHQAIYSFRGASNAMELIRGDQEFGLTGSFRFGPEVADIANRLLALKHERLKVRGMGAPSSITEISRRDGHALVSRGNASLFKEAVRCLMADRPFAFVGDIRNYRLDQIVEVYNLYAGNEVKDPFIGAFASFNELAEYGDSLDDREVKGRVNLVTKYEDQIPDLVDRIQAKSLPFDPESKDVLPDNAIVLTTAHRSKGLEFDNVKLANDFKDLIDDEGKVFDLGDASAQDIEELNLQYVAATRAKKTLQLSDGLQVFIEFSKSLDNMPSTRMAP